MKLTVKQLKKIVSETFRTDSSMDVRHDSKFERCGDRSGIGLPCILPKNHPEEKCFAGDYNDPSSYHTWVKKAPAPRSFLDAHKKMSEADDFGLNDQTEYWNESELNEELLPAIEYYTGSKVDSLRTKIDPRVRGTVAIRAMIEGNVVDFLLVGYTVKMTPEEIANMLEEVEFSSWPPRSGELRF